MGYTTYDFVDIYNRLNKYINDTFATDNHGAILSSIVPLDSNTLILTVEIIYFGEFYDRIVTNVRLDTIKHWDSE
jgi:hypothetical protein